MLEGDACTVRVLINPSFLSLHGSCACKKKGGGGGVERTLQLAYALWMWCMNAYFASRLDIAQGVETRCEWQDPISGAWSAEGWYN